MPDFQVNVYLKLYLKNKFYVQMRNKSDFQLMIIKYVMVKSKINQQNYTNT